MDHFCSVAIAIAHGALLGLIAGVAAMSSGADFCPWFGWTAAMDAGLILFNMYAPGAPDGGTVGND
ncbi:hypothetical protein [Salidesulfovibrio brasiliensis]|uniref:hypothetical protein n=1 Tax=Salidesulfovibrio brasiliensis TaxID=221711 RepID=UPI0006D16F13|nr:hypothetical protein [Salidesulfovibrio brasiliensis]